MFRDWLAFHSQTILNNSSLINNKGQWTSKAKKKANCDQFQQNEELGLFESFRGV